MDQNYISYFPERKRSNRFWRRWVCLKPTKVVKYLKHVFKSGFTRRPYFAFVYTLLSLPLSLLYFSIIYIGFLIATIFSPLIVGMFLFAFVALFIRFFVVIEVYLAGYLLCMSHKILPRFSLANFKEQVVVGIKAISSRSHSIPEEDPLTSNAKDGFITSIASPIANRRDPKTSTEISVSHNTNSSYNISLATQEPRNINDPYRDFFTTPPSRSVEFMSPTSPLKQAVQSSNMDEAFHHYDSDYSDDSVDSIHSPTSHNSYYYQHYGAMLGRSLDVHGGARQSQRIIHTNILPASAAHQPTQPQETTTLIQPYEESETIVEENNEEPLSVWDRAKRFYNNCYDFTFCKEVGFGLLYFTMKVPISLFTFLTSLILIGIPICAVAFPLFHIICSASDASKSSFCKVVMSETHEAPYSYIAWTLWFSYSVAGNVLIGLFGIVSFPFCIYGLRFLTRFSRDAILLVSKTVNES
ncbi:hypothetical protein C9374_006926 [Naegleria lovaniensis]|uniref:Uncharacterized protein n=1 Tax=Naegleria lovaniensis TaxID=51637 RepID=A0AA88GYN5_NAELO|nr:uncharacterized protein C9374_006926 [Naegleria lovaniensis]KAG2393395.1 hypothetical protein C9374_006926 [Naegleria lovaniensis]